MSEVPLQGFEGLGFGVKGQWFRVCGRRCRVGVFCLGFSPALELPRSLIFLFGERTRECDFVCWGFSQGLVIENGKHFSPGPRSYVTMY